MAKETKEERELRRAAEERIAALMMEEYLSTLPKRMLEIQANAAGVGMQTVVTLTQTGPALRLWENSESFFEKTITYETEEWEVEHTEQHIQSLIEAKAVRERQRGIAEDVWLNKLTQEEKDSVKANIHFLR